MKKNPFCIGSFPGPDSVGDHCYQPQQGTFHYDWPNKQLRFDYNQRGSIFNTTLTTYHRKSDMWIIVDYKLLHQCICLDPGRSQNISLYPINPEFMKEDSRYIGREDLYIEYIWTTKTVDHWVKGPHHIWSDVETGYILRMWQPFNGLEVFNPDKWDLTVDSKVFDIPPAMCKKQGGAWWRIGCADDGSVVRNGENDKNKKNEKSLK